MPGLARLIFVVSMTVQAENAHPQAKHASQAATHGPTVYSPIDLGTEHLIDFSQFSTAEQAAQFGVMSSFLAETTADLSSGSTSSRSNPATGWFKAATTGVLMPDHRLVPVDVQADGFDHPLDGISGRTKGRFIPPVPLSNRLQAKLDAHVYPRDGWAPLNANRMSWPDATHPDYHLPAYNLLYPTHQITSRGAGSYSARRNGQIELIAFEIGTDGTQLFAVRHQNAHHTVGQPSVGLVPTTWTDGPTIDADGLLKRPVRPAPGQAALFGVRTRRPPLIRPAVSRAAIEERELVALTPKTDALYSSDERLITLQSLDVPESSRRAYDVLLLPQHSFDQVSLAQPIGLSGSEDGLGHQKKAFALDKGWLVANGLTVPVGRLGSSNAADDTDGGVISLIPFIDTGPFWNQEVTSLPTYNPWTIGAGIGWQITGQTDLRLGVDIPLVDDSSTEDEDERELGVQFRIGTALGK